MFTARPLHRFDVVTMPPDPEDAREDMRLRRGPYQSLVAGRFDNEHVKLIVGGVKELGNAFVCEALF